MTAGTDHILSKAAVITDIKDISKRMDQLTYVSLAICLVTLPAYLIYSLYLSAALLGSLILIILSCVVFNLRGYQKYTKPVLLVMVMIFIALLVFATGLAAGGQLYYLPLLFALPLLTESKKASRKELLFYFLVNSGGFVLCIALCPQKSSWQQMTDEMFKRIYYVNTGGTMFVSIIFVYFNYHFENKYAAALVKLIAKAEEAMHTRTRFLSNMGHELRTPLNGISGIINLLQKHPLSTEQREYVKLLNYCSDQMLCLVNDVLDFNKIEVGQLILHPIAFNLKQTIQQAALPFYHRFEEKKVQLKIAIDPEVNQHVFADDLRLVQVINNLLSNALKFTPFGEVKLQVECVNKQQHQIRVKFSVQDSGIGIDEQYQNKIFNSFEQVINERTRKQEGAGLGLSICQRLLELMESKLHVSSTPGHGSTFYFTCTFPVVHHQKTEKKVETQTHDLSGISVLVAEDNPINLMIVSKMLKDWNAQFKTAVNGREALDALAVHPPFSVVLLDLQMPEMDGYEAIAEIRRLYGNLPVIAFTASLVDDVMKQELDDMGFSDVLTKPFQPSQLYQSIQSIKHSLVDVYESITPV